MKESKVIAIRKPDAQAREYYGLGEGGYVVVDVQVAKDTDKATTTTWYNAITARVYKRGALRPIACGFCHDLVARLFPEFRDMLELHMTDIHGAPSYPVENGLYHALENGAETLADYFMVSKSEAEDIVRRVFRSKTERGQRQVMQNAVRKLRPRWEARAKEVMSRYAAMPEVA